MAKVRSIDNEKRSHRPRNFGKSEAYASKVENVDR